jgi:hypothetical protein
MHVRWDGTQLYAARMALQYLMKFGAVHWIGRVCFSSNLVRQSGPTLCDPLKLVFLPWDAFSVA